MATISTQKNILAPVSGAVSNHHAIGQYSFCDACHDPAGVFSPALIHPYFPSEPARCQSCGHLDEDVLSYNFVTPKKRQGGIAQLSNLRRSLPLCKNIWPVWILSD